MCQKMTLPPALSSVPKNDTIPPAINSVPKNNTLHPDEKNFKLHPPIKIKGENVESTGHPYGHFYIYI